MASYPNNIFATGSYRPTTNEPLIINKHWDSIANEIPAIENELGTNPSGYAADVKTRLDDINPSEGNLNLDAGYGSKAPIYGVRAWVNFNGSGTVAIRESANVSSITDNGTGDYTVNFTSAMPDADYAAVYGRENASSAYPGGGFAPPFSAGSVRLVPQRNTSGINVDVPIVTVAIIR
jgi:hypothetical protein